MKEFLSEMAAKIEALVSGKFAPRIGVAAREITADNALYPEEQLFVARAVATRQAEFSTGRRCARLALNAVGCRPCPIPVGPQLAPQWPVGFVGSITHSAGFAVAVAAPCTLYRSMGIDLCVHSVTADALSQASGVISNGAEIEAARAAIKDGVDPRVLLFSAKESAIKVLSPGLGRYLDFKEISVRIEKDKFIASAGLNREVHGWWSPLEGLLLTGASLPPELNS